ncbi:hypothetical protein HELRODRAFT_174936 [Helobdella robusta]|uniref:Condensin complex subunit 2 n=1 Tax=Helobdella robusta TaxID=6412 RepID=T1F8M8_HELRO|nr:hypothetical protein HELRODRAFT_174936 [Helobdella robusta]ESO01381.1 hypothetical protein HELRODRAFT_174936 [Helobdella robusta]
MAAEVAITPLRLRSPGLVSPSGRRALSVVTSKGMVDSLGSRILTNDDDHEKNNQIIDSAKKSKSDVQTEPVTRTDVNASDHLQLCLKLSAENKITKKNAFDLHLINIAEDVIIGKGDTDFNLAAYALEACAKIYGCRVDSLHDIACKLSTRLKVATKDGEDGDEDRSTMEDPGRLPTDETLNDEEADRQKEKEKKKKKKKSKVIETNLKNITLDNLDSELDMNPYFKKSITAFDMGASKSLILNLHHTYNDTCSVMTDLNKPFNIWDILDDDVQQQQKQLSKAAVHYVYVDNLQPSVDLSFFDKYRFDKDAEPITNDNNNNNSSDTNNDFYDDDVMDHDVDNVVRSDNDSTQVNLHTSSSAVMLTDMSGDMLKMHETVQKIKAGDISSLRDALELNHEGSMYKKDFLKMWAGPDHWKKSLNIPTKKNSARTKETFLVKFTTQSNVEENDRDSELPATNKSKKSKTKLIADDAEWHFMKTKAKTTRGLETFLESDGRSLLLPEVSEYEEGSLMQLFHANVKIVDHTPENQASVDVRKYDYNNNNDRLNFCPSQPNNNGGEDDDDDVGPYNGAADYGDEANDDDAAKSLAGDGGAPADAAIINDDDDNADNGDDDMNGGTFINQVEREGNGGAELAFGEDLVPQPRMIPRTEIDYVRVDKKIDMDLLKKVLYGIIKKNFDKSTSVLFTQLYKDLQKQLPKKLASDLSIPIAFSSLLHLANEHSLYLESTPDDGYTEVVVAKAVTS